VVLEGIEFALALGSAPTDASQGHSDGDLPAVRFPSHLDAPSWLGLSGELPEILRRPVDLLGLCRAADIVAMQVLHTGIPLLVDDCQAFEQVRMYMPSLYFDYKRAGRPIEQALHGEASRWPFGARRTSYSPKSPPCGAVWPPFAVCGGSSNPRSRTGCAWSRCPQPVASG
jgi:hypothetical protein